ncbi:MAG: hypothetical protein PHU71_07045 [Candidatus Gracilibacteria bacterium]|nr:hypothetical protein [Candidatus Gracilibacteria bacterium]
MTKYLSAAETAKVVRKMLKTEFPNTKFSVRSESYSMGSAVSVRWTDGPIESEVDSVVGALAGSGFDSMIDLKYTVTHWMTPDGKITIANSQGSTGSSGIHNQKPCNEAIEVNFADHISCNRKYSEEFLDRIAKRINEKMFNGKPVALVEHGGLNTSEMIINRVFWRIQSSCKIVNNKIICNTDEYSDIISEK